MHLLDCQASLASLGAFLCFWQVSVTSCNHFGTFWCIPKLSLGLLDISATHCMHVHASDVSVGLLSLFDTPMHGFAPLAGRSHVTNLFADVFDLFATSSTCMCAVCMPGQLSSPSFCLSTVLHTLAGKSSGFASFGHVLTHLCVPSHMHMYCNAMHVFVHVWHAFTASGLNFVTSSCIDR